MKKYTLLIFFILFCVGVFLYLLESKPSISNQGEINNISISHQEIASAKFEKKSVGDSTNTDSDLFITKYYNDLPQIADISELSEADVHDTPEIVLNAARIISQVEKDGQSNDKERSAALSFLKACAEDDHLLTSVRALCLSKVYRLMPRWNRVIVIESKKIPKEVESLALEVI